MSRKRDSKVRSNSELQPEKTIFEHSPLDAGCCRTSVRRILAGSGGIIAAVAAGSWSKSILNSVVTLSHTQTSTVLNRLRFVNNQHLGAVFSSSQAY